MNLQELTLKNFRNFKEKKLAFNTNTTVIVGDNAIGKTNILESIYLLSTGKSFKASIEEEMINYDSDLARVKGELGAMNYELGFPNESESEKVVLEVVLTKGEIDIGGETYQKAPKKRLLLNNTPKRLIDFAGQFKVVLFAPTDLDLVTESPSIRRKFLDAVLSQTDREYRRCIMSYEKGLRQRNKLLYRIREEGISRSQLVFWNHLLIKNGDYIAMARSGFIEYLNDSQQFPDKELHISYDKSAISEVRLEQYKNEEVASATTLVGPHRDDIIFEIKKGDDFRSLASYGSRGEQRMGILWTKLSELNFIEEKTEMRPILLLDDIFSELDHTHRDIVFEVIEKQQTIVTTADSHYVEGMGSINRIDL